MPPFNRAENARIAAKQTGREQLRDNPETPFDRKFLVPPIVSCIIALVTLPLALSALPKELMESAAVSTSGLVAVFLAVWGATDVARSGLKFVGAQFLSGNKSRGGIS